MRQTLCYGGTFDEDCLVMEGQRRPARLLDVPLRPKPLSAALSVDGFLSWKYLEPVGTFGMSFRSRGGLHKPHPRLCFQFARLAAQSDEAIRRFAQKWGPLEIDDSLEEPIGSWRVYIRLAQALLRFSSDRASGGVGDKEDWETIWEWRISRSGPPFAQKHANSSSPAPKLNHLTFGQYCTDVVGGAINKWYARSRDHTLVSMADRRLQVRPSSGRLLGVLISQIAHVVVGCDEMAVCAGCGRAFIHVRQPSRGIRRYCARCRQAGIPQRDASRDWRRRAAEKRSRRKK